MILFETDKKPLTFLLDQIENQALALPDFQRSFVWDPNATRELVVSVIRSFPAGSLLVMQGGAAIFAPREFEEAPALSSSPLQLVLDGQQRLTSLYQAFAGRGTHRFFLNIQELIDGYDVDEAVEVYTVERARRWIDTEGQADQLMLPLSRLRDFTYWRDDILEAQEGVDDDLKKLKAQLNEIERDYVKPVELYQFPVTTLAASTPAEAVCTIFETLNRTGVRLSPFELITARAFAGEVRLRDMWERATNEHPILTDFQVDPYYLLQVIATTARGSPKRSVVLSLDVGEIVQLWDSAVLGMVGSLKCLRDQCGVLTPQLLPYAPMLVTMAAAWRGVADAKGPAQGARRQKLIRWFWCGIFGGAYDNAPNSATERDVPQLLRWFDSDDAPFVIRTFGFGPRRWAEATVRQRALYRASLALFMKESPREFHTGAVLDRAIIEGSAVDDHHIFPRKFLKDSGLRDAVDSVLNHTLIDRITNIRIGGRPPSAYLAEIEAEVGGEALQAILESHCLPADGDGPLWGDRFEEFLQARQSMLTDRLAAAAGVEPDALGILRAHEWSEDVQTAEETSGQKELPDDVEAFIRSRTDGEEEAALLRGLLNTLSTWPDVRFKVGKSERSADGFARMIMAHRHGSNLGAFAYLLPNGRALLRLSGFGEEREGVQVRNVKASNKYRVRVRIDPSTIDTFLELTRVAYDETYR